MVGLAVVACASLLAACNSGNGASTTGTIPAVTVSTKPYSFKKLRADLQITGSDTFTVKGVVGQCRYPAAGLPVAYSITGLPQLGRAGSITVWGPTHAPGVGTIEGNVKALINGVGLISPNSGAGVTVHPDLQAVDLNADATGVSTGASFGGVQVAAGLRSDHIAGTIRCT
jgi:hypothetical protein